MVSGFPVSKQILWICSVFLLLDYSIWGEVLSCMGMAQNEVRLQLNALAYNLGVFLQGVDLPEEMVDWSLTSLQTRLIKIGARVVRHARSITFQLAEVAVTGDLYTRILAAIYRLRSPPVTA